MYNLERATRKKSTVDLHFLGELTTHTDFVAYFQKIGYNIDVIQQTAGMVFNPVTVDKFASLFNCTPAGPASDSMMAPA